MNLDLVAIRTALAAQLGNVAGLEVYRNHPGIPVVPSAGAAVIVMPDQYYVSYAETFPGQIGALADVSLLLQVYAQSSDPVSGQDRIDELLSSGNGQSRSIIDAIEADRTLGGVVETTLVLTAQDPTLDTTGPTPLFVVHLPVSVRARRG